MKRKQRATPLLPLKKEEDYYLTDKGLMVFTEQYHLKRGYCCNSGCKHCPYTSRKKSK